MLTTITITNIYNKQDRVFRRDWKRYSEVEAFSVSKDTWISGRIVRIFEDEEGEWLETDYAYGMTTAHKGNT